jgi:hypothetical protein
MRKYAATSSRNSCHLVAFGEYIKPHNTGTLASPLDEDAVTTPVADCPAPSRTSVVPVGY